MQVFGEYPAKDRAGDAGRNPHAAEIGLILAALARRHHVGNHRLHDRQDAAAAEPLQAARQDQHRHVGRQRAQDRARNEQAERGDDHGAAAVDIAQGAEYRGHRGRRQQIGGDDPRQAGDVLELAADGRQRGRDDGLVQRRQKHRQHQAHQDGTDFARRERDPRRNRRRVADLDDLARYPRQLARDVLGQDLLVGRSRALPFKLVHREGARRLFGFNRGVACHTRNCWLGL